MHIRFIEIRNFRKLEAVRIDFTHETTVFVGPNNSGKTSAMTALQYFLVYQGRFTPDDFTASNWQPINKIGSDWEANPSEPGPAEDSWRAVLPSLDLWLEVGDDELHHISQFLPTLDWAGGLLGVRLQLEPKDVEDCRAQYLSAVAKAKETVSSIPQEGDASAKAPKLWPRDMCDFLERRLRALFTVQAYALDPAKQAAPKDGLAQPQALPVGSEAIEGESLERLIRIDIIPAHRDLADTSGADRTAAGGSSREHREGHRLSAQLRSYYDKHLDPQNAPEVSDLDALEAIQNAQELFDEKLRKGFSSALSELENLGYPGVANPKLTIPLSWDPSCRRYLAGGRRARRVRH
jgi:predicted ATP-dependent endonuclease of OLD family